MIYGVLFLYEVIVCYFFDKLKLNDVKAISINDYKLKMSIKKLIMLVIIIIPPSLIMGLRYKIGADYTNYEIIFKQASLYHKNSYNIEVAYYFLNRVVGIITDNSQIIFLVTAFIINVLFIKAILDNGNSLLYGYLAFIGMGYYFYAMNLQRQYIAIGIMFYAFQFLETKQFRKYMLCVIISACFHVSSIIWVPLYFIINYVDSKVFYTVSFGIGLLVNISGQYILNILAKLQFYTNQILNNEKFFATHFSILNVLIASIFLLCCILLYKHLIMKYSFNNKRIKMVWLLLLSYIFLYKLGEAVIRIASYMCPVYFVLLGDIISCFSIKFQRFAKIIIIIILCLLMYILVAYGANTNNRFLPYVYRWSSNQ